MTKRFDTKRTLDAKDLLAKLASLSSQAERAAFLRALVIATLQASKERAVVVGGKTIFSFDSLTSKQDHLEALKNGAWGSDTDIRILAALFDVDVIAHVTNPSSTKSGVPAFSFNLSHDDTVSTTRATRTIDAAQKKPVLHVVNRGNVHWEAAAEVGKNKFAAVETPGDGSCAFHAFHIGLSLNGLLEDESANQAQRQDQLYSFESGSDSELIDSRTLQASSGLIVAMDGGLTADKLLEIARNIANKIAKHQGSKDEFLLGHIAAFEARRVTRSAMGDFAGRLAARAAVNSYTFDLLQKELSAYLPAKAPAANVSQLSGSLFSTQPPPESEALKEQSALQI